MHEIMIIGSGGLAKEFYTIIKAINKIEKKYIFLGFADVENEGKVIIDGHKIIGDDDFVIKKFRKSLIVIGIGDTKRRKIISEKFEANNFKFPNIIHPTAAGDWENISFGKGNIISANSTFEAHINIGDFNYFNKNTTIGHDVIIGSYCQLNAGANISGSVEIDNCSLIGAGANIYQGVKIENNTTVALGTSIFNNTKSDSTYLGNPGKRI